VIVSILTII
jgi:hypothetical protein